MPDNLQISLEKLTEEVTLLNKKIAQLQSHNITLATLIGNIIDGDAVSGSIQEISVLLDLSKEDLRISHQLISSYDGNIELLKKKFFNPNGNLSEENLFPIVNAYRNSGNMVENCDKIMSNLQI